MIEDQLCNPISFQTWDDKLEESAKVCADSCRTYDEKHCPRDESDPNFADCKCAKNGDPGENFHSFIPNVANVFIEWYVVMYI